MGSENDHDRLLNLLGGYDEYRLAHRLEHDAEHEAREKAYSELQRRLETLNHAHEAAVEVQHTYLRQDTFESELERLRADIRRVQDDLRDVMPRSEIRLALDTIAGRADATAQAVSQQNSILARLSGSLAGQGEGQEEAQRNSDRNRNIIVAAMTILVAVVGVVVAIVALR